MDADYLVVGAGLAGMGFVDTLVDGSDASVVLVDRRQQPGGHWNDAYPFVRLHLPSATYGVNSRELGANRIDGQGPNAGFYERACRVVRIGPQEIVLEHGRLPTDAGQVHIDCTARGLRFAPPCPIFEPGMITIQPVRQNQPAISAALLGPSRRPVGTRRTRTGSVHPSPTSTVPPSGSSGPTAVCAPRRDGRRTPTCAAGCRSPDSTSPADFESASTNPACRPHWRATPTTWSQRASTSNACHTDIPLGAPAHCSDPVRTTKEDPRCPTPASRSLPAV
jgi:hypothetical protein